MEDIVANIYLLARKYSGIKRIDAAQELAIAESTLKKLRTWHSTSTRHYCS